MLEAWLDVDYGIAMTERADDNDYVPTEAHRRVNALLADLDGEVVGIDSELTDEGVRTIT